MILRGLGIIEFAVWVLIFIVVNFISSFFVYAYTSVVYFVLVTITTLIFLVVNKFFLHPMKEKILNIIFPNRKKKKAQQEEQLRKYYGKDK